MLTPSWLSSLTSKSAPLHTSHEQITDTIYRQNPAVMSQAGRCFTFVAQALEAETLQGNMAQRIVGAARKLVQTAGLDANQLLAGLPPDTQQTVRTFFG